MVYDFYFDFQCLINLDEYRSGHNGPHSKCGSPLKGLVGSNPTSSVGYFLDTRHCMPSFLFSIVSPYLKTALEKNLYLYLYVDAFVSSVLKSAVKPQEAIEDVRKYLLNDSELIGIDTNSPEAFAIAIRMVFVNDIKRRQKLLLEDLDVICGENKEYKDCSSLQRMYLLILSGKNYHS